MKNRKAVFFMALLVLFAGAFIACSNGDDGGNESQQTATVTVTYYGDTTSTTPRTVSLETGSTLSEKLATAPDGYDFEAWISADGTDWTIKAITSDITLFAYFVKSSSSTSGTTTTTTTSEKSVETDKTTTVTTDSESGTTVTKVEETTTKIGSTETVETESTTTKTADGTTTNESTVTTKDADGNMTSKVETTVAADGTTTTTTTDASGKTTTETTGGSGEKLEVSLDNAGYPTFEIPIPRDSDIYIETLSISVYRKKNGDATYSKILDVYQNRKDSFETNPGYEFTDLYVAKSASYSYYYQISGENGTGNFTKTSGKSDFVSITNGKLGELVASVSGGEVSFNAKTGILTLSTLPTVPSDFSYMLKMKNLDYGYWIRRAGTYYQSKGSTIDLFKTQKGKTLIPYWYVCLYESDDYLREEWYPIVSEFYGTDYGLPESITVPTEISTDTDEADTTLANTSYKSTELKMNGSAAPSGVSETISFASDGKNCTLTGYYNSTGTYTVSGTSVTVNYTSGDILGTMTGTLTNSNATLTAQGTVTVSGESVLMYGVFAKQGGGSDEKTYTVTVAELAETATSITASKATIIVTDATDDTLSSVATAVKSINGVFVSLDLSQSTDVTTLSDSIFEYCSNLAEITLPETITTIGKYAFAHSPITKITIPDSVTEIGTGILQYCTSLESATLGSGITTIEHYTFKGCTTLSDVTLGSNATKIEYDSFQNCTSLESITIPASITNLSSLAFEGCSKLTTVTVESGNSALKSIDNVVYSLDGKTLLLYPARKTGDFSIPDGVTSFDTAFKGNTNLTGITIPSSVSEICSYAFNGCTALESVTIPASVTEIGRDAFSLCSSLTNFTLEDGNTVYTAIDGVLYTNGGTTLSVFPAGRTSFAIPDTVTLIDYYAFEDNSKLESITIPASVTRIAIFAFNNCSKLTSATFADTESTWYKTSSSSYTNGTEIGAFSATDTATNATKLKSTYKNYYLYNSNYSAE